VPFVHKTTLNRKYVSRRDFHDPAVNIGNYLMHYTRFEGTRGVLDGEKALPELDLPPENKTGTFFPSVHANCMMGFGIDSVSATEVYPEGPEHTVLVSSFLVPKRPQSCRISTRSWPSIGATRRSCGPRTSVPPSCSSWVCDRRSMSPAASPHRTAWSTITTCGFSTM